MLKGVFATGIRLAVILVAVSALLAATPKQAERPPQPFFQDFFSGTVLVEGEPAPQGTQLIACINGCKAGFQSQPYLLHAGGLFDQLEVNPVDETLVGHLITFYLVNEFGKIQAQESRPYIGVFDFYVQHLTFVDPMPGPLATPTPSPPEPTPRPTPVAALPVTGDPDLARLPKYFLLTGGVVVVLGGGLLVIAARGRS